MGRGLGLRHAALVLAVLALAACSAPAPKPNADGSLPPGVTPLRYALDLTIDPRQPRFSGVARIRVKMDAPTKSFWIHGKQLAASAVTVTPDNGQSIAATYTENGEGFAEIVLARQAPAGEATLSITYDAPFGDDAAGLYRAESAGEMYAMTQFQAIDARRAFPGFDEPRHKTPFDVTVTARAGDTVIANTMETKAEPAGEGLVRHTFAPSLPLPTYLLAFAVGPYEVVQGPVLPPTALRAHPVPLRGVAAKGKGEQTRYALSITAGMMAYFEDYFATPYPYDKLDFVAAPDFAAGAMENAGAIIYAEPAILMNPGAPVTQQRGVIMIHAHEIAHQWFGNLVTPRWWDDIWLNEAFATWMSYKAGMAVVPDAGFERDTQLRALAAMADDSLAAARRIREPIITESDIEDAFDAITYQKGGGVLAMAESYLGEDAFREGVRTHMRRFPFGVATSADFFESLGQGANRPEIVAALATFTDRSHVPLVDVRLDCPVDGGLPRVRLAQSTYQPLGASLERRTWSIPVCVSAYGLTGAASKSCTILSEAEGQLMLTGVCPAFVSPNAAGAGYYRYALDERGWTALVTSFRRMPPGEQIAALDSLNASFLAGRASASLLLRAVEAAAGATDPAVRRQAVDVARALALVAPDTEAAREAFALWVRVAFARSGAEAAQSARASPAERQAGAVVTRLLALTGADPVVRARLLAGARAAVGLSSATPAPLDLRAVALIVGVLDGGPEFFARLLDIVRTTQDAQLRAEGLVALSYAPRAEDQETFAETILNAPVTGSQMRRALNATQTDPLTAPLGLKILSERFDALAGRLPGGLAGQSAPRFAEGLCSEADRRALEALFRENAAKVPGYERSLAQAMERIARCAAAREARGGELARALNTTN
ncbi:MAG: M1 family metallopeptidase [Hyphomonadaceae bacterium]|nr:M1 family metallopeptidase [Hyphomonadaceae bacterium]